MKINFTFFFMLGYIILVCLTFLTNAATVVEPREAYFNGSAYLRLITPMPIWRHSGISFRSCKGGEILSQQYSGHTLSLSISSDAITISLLTTKNRVEARIPVRLLDNEWHSLQFLYQLGNLNFVIDRQSVIIANSTYNTLFLSDQEIRNEAAVLILGKMFTGCFLHGPGLLFNTSAVRSQGVVFGPCPLIRGPCSDQESFTRIVVDHCLNEPCMQHGSCISRADDYVCQCTTRYTGKNCEFDSGPPCKSQPCQNFGTCQENNQGNFKCYCPLGYSGTFCETEVVIHPLCEKNPCLNNSTCKVAPNSSIYECECNEGFTGVLCGIDKNECEVEPCLHGGQCFDEVRGFSCDCTGTGYSGSTCQHNIDECALNNPCLNSGICFDTYGFFICECTDGFGGTNCEILLNECQSEPCQQGGTCFDLQGNFTCICPPGYTGKTCDQSIPCPQCPNDSDCIGGKCICKAGTTGLVGHCVGIDTEISGKSNACSTICLNGATCAGTASNISCICPSGFTGNRCESPMALPFSDECSCMNGGTCNFTTNECICPSGFEGARCERVEACSSSNCVEPMACLGGTCICPEGASCSNPCSSAPCHNGATCLTKGTDFICQCTSGYTGPTCTVDINECDQQKTLCGHGICVNRNGSFNCYCEPGFTGGSCDLDVDECLSHPCKNGATCVNLVNDFECTCPAGYSGKDCGVDIDECAGNPCFNGSTCKDLVASFSCICIPGMTGELCDIDIDDCESSPCQHGGHCIDQLGGFNCDCNGTGFSGLYCQVNIDECLSMPCENGAECTDKINDYYCDCYDGYSGKNCQIDIDECESGPCLFEGRCLQRSNLTLYNMPIGVRNTLPQIFSQKFSYSNASGFECICVPGIIGKKCDININECEPNPCTKNGNCVDGIGKYTCECEPGYMGLQCEIDINECDLYKPCVHGTCIDQRDNYFCDCDTLWGGKNCSVSLKGCLNSPCLNNGTCFPYVENETQHKFNCSCHNGYQGSTCEKVTTMSLAASSLLTVNTTRDEGYEIHLRFKTTLPNGILAFGNGYAYSYILELVDGRLNLHSSLLNKWEGVFIGTKLNDSKWQKVFVAINSSHLVLSANEEQTIYPINSYEGTNASHTSFPVTNLGGTIPNLNSYLRHLTHGATSFVGCMEDVVINGQWIFPFESNMNTTLVNVETGCPREPQCNPNPCNSNGLCSDLWHTFSCTCQRPHLGPTCKYNITAATFGNENTTHAAVLVDVSEGARRAIRSVLDISMFIRTRQSSGQIFYLGSDPRKFNAALSGSEKRDSYVSAKLHGGELLVKIQFNGTPEAYTVGGNKLDNGYNHLIQVIRNLTLVHVKLNGTEYFRKTLSSTGQLDAQVLYLGGPPPIIDGFDVNLSKEQDEQMYFKGIIQDVQVSNGSHAMMVELYPLNVDGLILPPPFGNVKFDKTSVLEGEVTDDICRTTPCSHFAVCKNTWNDFVCICPRGYKGRYCQDIQFCELNKCPGLSSCQNLDDGFECISTVTFKGIENKPLPYTFIPKEISLLNSAVVKSTMEIAYRTKTGGSLLFVQDENDMYFEVSTTKEIVIVEWRLSSELPENQTFSNETSNYDWSTLFIQVENGKLDGGWKGWESLVEPLPLITKQIDQNAFNHLFSGKFPIYLGGIPLINSNSILKRSNMITNYKGCLGETRINGYLLPFFPHLEIYPESTTPISHFSLNSSKPEEGCVVCFQTDCTNGGICTNPSDIYSCDCPAGYAQDDCSENIDECLNANCENNSTCIDGIANYTCSCQPGYEGEYCETEINECDSSPCHNEGTCLDQIGTFECSCPEDYAGPQCDILRLVTCANLPCRNGSTCLDGYNTTTGNNFTCVCMPGLDGTICDIPFCRDDPCLNDGYCLEKDIQPTCQCFIGFTGRFCEIDINECESQPCQNNGNCTDGRGGYSCNCTNIGYEGLNCEVDIDECSTERHNCDGSRYCVNTRGSFKCQCPTGSCGANCDIVDPCLMDDVCQNNALCIEACSTFSDYICNCTEGFAGKNCSLVAARSDEQSSHANILIIVIPIVIGLLIIGGAFLAAFLIMARNKRATRGTYSPSAQEYCNPRLEMDNVLKPPPEERLI